MADETFKRYNLEKIEDEQLNTVVSILREHGCVVLMGGIHTGLSYSASRDNSAEAHAALKNQGIYVKAIRNAE